MQHRDETTSENTISFHNKIYYMKRLYLLNHAFMYKLAKPKLKCKMKNGKFHLANVNVHKYPYLAHARY